MPDLNQKLDNAKHTILNAETTTKAYTIRIPTDLSLQIEALIEYSGKPKNTVISEIIDLGYTYFLSSLEEHERFEIGQIYEQLKLQMAVDGMGGN